MSGFNVTLEFKEVSEELPPAREWVVVLRPPSEPLGHPEMIIAELYIEAEDKDHEEERYWVTYVDKYNPNGTDDFEEFRYWAPIPEALKGEMHRDG